MQLEKIRYKKVGRLVWLTIDNPPANTLSLQTFAELDAAVDAVAADPDVSIVVLAGAGRFFSTGADIKEMPTYDFTVRREFQVKAHATQWKMEQGDKLYLAAVQGGAVGGGCELALTCDLVVCSESAYFGLPEPRVGIIPGFGGIQRIARRLPLAPAFDLLVSCDRWDAATALRFGLVSRVLPDEGFAGAVQELAERIAGGAPASLRSIKRAVLARQQPLEDALQLEVELAERVWRTQDKQEGIEAFIAKRAPAFRNC